MFDIFLVCLLFASFSFCGSGAEVSTLCRCSAGPPGARRPRSPRGWWSRGRSPPVCRGPILFRMPYAYNIHCRMPRTGWGHILLRGMPRVMASHPVSHPVPRALALRYVEDTMMMMMMMMMILLMAILIMEITTAVISLVSVLLNC